MNKPNKKYLPTVTETADGRIRAVGVELEFIGIDLDECIDILQDRLGGDVDAISDYEAELTGDSAGPWRIERDQELLKRLGRARDADDSSPDIIDTTLEAALKLGSELIVPLEIVSPPLPVTRLHEFDELITVLRKAGATGTKESFVYAFGLHLNPELPDLECTTIRHYMQAFACLQEWLFKRCDIDAARQVTRYTAPWPTSYIKMLIASDYAPQMEQLIKDYFEENPTRNRALDMLPLFMHLDKATTGGLTDDPRIKSRPTFHYRLPNSKVGETDWSLLEEWEGWLQVEKLAADTDLLKKLCAFYAELLDKPFGKLLPGHVQEVEEWLTTNL